MKPARTDKTPDTAKKLKVGKREVLAYLLKNPSFLVAHAGALAGLSVPAKGGNIMSLHAAAAAKSAAVAQQNAAKTRQLVSIAAANAGVAEVIFGAALNVVGCETLGAFRTYVQVGLLRDLGLDAARFYAVGAVDGASTLTAERIEELCAAPVMLRSLTRVEEREIYGPKGKLMMSDCLLRLVDVKGRLVGLLAMGSKDAARFHAGQSVELVAFFGALVGVRVGQLV